MEDNIEELIGKLKIMNDNRAKKKESYNRLIYRAASLLYRYAYLANNEIW